LCHRSVPPFRLLTSLKPASINISTAARESPPPEHMVTISFSLNGWSSSRWFSSSRISIDRAFGM